MAKKRGRTVVRYVKRARHKAAGMTLPLAVVAGFIPLAMSGLAGFKEGGVEGLGHQLAMGTTGYDHREHKFRGGALVNGLGPILLGIMVHKFAGKMGINRAIAGAGVPFVRI